MIDASYKYINAGKVSISKITMLVMNIPLMMQTQRLPPMTSCSALLTPLNTIGKIAGPVGSRRRNGGYQ